MKGTENLFGRFLSLFGAKVLTTVAAVLSTPIIVRLLGPGGYGDYAVLLSIFSLYMIPISAAITEGVQKFVAEAREIDAWTEHVLSFYFVLAVVMVTGGGVVLLTFTALGYAEAIFGERFTVFFYLLAVFVFVSQFRALAYHTVLGFGLEPISESLNVVKKLVTVLLGIGLVLVGYGVSGMLVGHIVANLVLALLAGYVVLRRVSIRDLLHSPPAGFPYRELLSFNALNVVLVLLVMSLFHVDIVMIRTVIGNETTGYYKAALALAEYLWFVPISLQALLLHSSSALWSDGREAEISDLASRITRYTILLVVLMAMGLAVLADRFVPLYYGEEFAVATTPLLLLLPGTIGFAAARPIQAISQGSGRIGVLVAASGGAAVLNFGLNALLIPPFGMIGAATATSVGYGSMFVFLVLAARRIGYDPLADLRGLRIAATALFAAPFVVGADLVLANDVMALVLVPPIGAISYSGAAIATGAVDVAELRTFLGKLPGSFGSNSAARADQP